MNMSLNWKESLGKRKIDFLLIMIGIIEFIIGIVAFSNNVTVIFLALVPSIASYARLRIKLAQREKQSSNVKEMESKRKIPIFLFVAVISPILVGVAILAFNEPKQFLTIFYDVLIFLILALTFLMTIFFVPLAIYSMKRKLGFVGKGYPVLSVIVPAYNEQASLDGTINSILETDYNNMEIIVIDDGSTDDTYYVASKYSKSLPNGRFSVLRRPNGGKAAAINYGILYSRGEIIVVVDADCKVERSSLNEIAGEFRKPGVIAVAGGVKISNCTNLLTNCQALEYLISINIHRRAFGSSGITLIVPGPLGAFRKKPLIERGLFDNNTSTEDFDVTMKMLRSGGQVPEIVAQSYTDAPSSLKELYVQRNRWYNGAFRTLIKHKGVLATSRYDVLGEFLFPIKFFSFIIFPFFDILILIFTFVAILNNIWMFPALWISLYLCWQFLVTIVAIILGGEKNWRLAIYAPLFVIGYRHFIDFVMMKAIFEVLFNSSKRNRV